MSLKKHLLDGTVVPPQPEPPREVKISAAEDDGALLIVTHSVEYYARELAGEWFEKNRTLRFRKTWGSSDKDQLRYVELNWKHFVEDVEKGLVELMGSAHMSTEAKDRAYDLYLEARALANSRQRASTSIQIARGTEHFDGDKSLNRDVDTVQ